nr:GAF domain-containing sensor histidine kinase [Pedococcus badiiscoriae]
MARRQAIEQYQVLDQPAEPDLQGLLELAAIVCEVPTTVINIIDDRLQHQIAAVGFAPGVCAREDSMCAVVLDEARRVEVFVAREDPRFAQNPFVTGEIAKVRFYASSPLVTPDGVVIGTLCVFDDSTGRLSSEAAHGLDVLARQVVDVLELRRTARELTRSNEQLAQFAGQVSHDLANPLAALSGFLEMASDSASLDAAPDVARALSRAELSAQRMQYLITDLLDYAQLGGRVRTTEVDVALLVDEVLEDLSARVRAAGAIVEVGELPVFRADRTVLRALVQNIVANAVKFSATSGREPHVTITVEPVTGGWRLAVDDDGPGVPPEERDRVFGLSTCERIVTAHGGRMGIDTSPWGGASVWAILPDRG